MIHTLKNEMERMWNQFDHKAFILNDPIQIVHQIRNLSGRTTADIEVCAILTAMVSWGQRSHIIYCAEKLMNVCGWEPGKYIKLGDFMIFRTNVVFTVLLQEKYLKRCVIN